MEPGEGNRAFKRKISPADEREHRRHYVCWACEKIGDLLCCSACYRTYHLSCLQPPLQEFPAGDWLCHFCDDEETQDTEDNIDGKRDVGSRPASPESVYRRRSQKKVVKDISRSFGYSEGQIEKVDDRSSSTSGLQNLRTCEIRRKLQNSELELSRKAGPSEQRRDGSHDVGSAGKDTLLILRRALKNVMKYDLGIQLTESDESTDEDEPEPRGKAIVPEERSAWYVTDKAWMLALENTNRNRGSCSDFGKMRSEPGSYNSLCVEEQDSQSKGTNQDRENDWKMMLTDPTLKLSSNETSNDFSERWWKQRLESFSQGRSSDKRSFGFYPPYSLRPVASSTSSRGTFELPSIILRRGRNDCTRGSAILFLKKTLKM